MNPLHSQPFARLAVCLLFTCFSSLAWAAATVQSLTGAAEMTPQKGAVIPLAVGQRIEPGVSIKTGLNSSVTLRFDDGQMISLAGTTTYSLDEYKFNPQKPEEGSFLSSLVKGGLRAVSGLIGEKNPKDVKFRTPVATAGIRGTDFDLFYDGRLYISVRAGAIAVSNEGGVALFSAKEQSTGLVSDVRSIARPADPTTFPAPAKSSIRQNAANQDLGAKPADPKDPTCSDRR
jgi:hypothetical protein